MDGGDDAESAVEAPAGRHRVEMRADQTTGLCSLPACQRPIRLPAGSISTSSPSARIRSPTQAYASKSSGDQATRVTPPRRPADLRQRGEARGDRPKLHVRIDFVRRQPDQLP